MTLTLSSPDDRLDAMLTDLRRKGEAFALATVVRTVDATSAKPGAKAIVLADGTIAEGWIGGACARAAVARAGAAAIREGRPQFVSLRPEDLLAAEGVAPGDERAGIRFARNGCPSRGSMDVFVEPVLPRPQLAVLGDSPVAQALVDLSGRFGLHRIHMAPGLAASPAEEIAGGFETLGPFAGRRFIVVATQGKGDEAGLRAALASGAEHVAFVGSRRKFAALAERLAAGGLPREVIAQVKAPAGLDIHAISPDEIALSILAEITILRRAQDRGQDPRGTTTERPEPGERAPSASAAAEAPLRPGLVGRLLSPLTADQARLLGTIRFGCC